MKQPVWSTVDGNNTYDMPCDMYLGVGQALCIMKIPVSYVYSDKRYDIHCNMNFLWQK